MALPRARHCPRTDGGQRLAPRSAFEACHRLGGYPFARAEQNYTDPELEPVFENIREEISSNLKKLLRNLPDPTSVELTEADEV